MLATVDSGAALDLCPVEITQAVLTIVITAVVDAASDNDVGRSSKMRAVGLKEVVGNEGIVIKEEKPFSFGMLEEEVTDACPTNVVVERNIGDDIAYRAVLGEKRLGGVVVNTNYLDVPFIAEIGNLARKALHQG